MDDLRSRSKSLNMIEISSKALSSAYFRTSKQLQILDLEHNIMQAKGLRTSLNVRIVHTKSREDDTVLYILRVGKTCPFPAPAPADRIHLSRGHRIRLAMDSLQALHGVLQFARGIELVHDIGQRYRVPQEAHVLHHLCQR